MSDENKTCVACAEEIKQGAALCRFCGTRQDDPSFAKTGTHTEVAQDDIQEADTIGSFHSGRQSTERQSRLPGEPDEEHPNALEVVMVLQEMLEQMPGANTSRFITVPVGDGSGKSALGVNPSAQLDKDFPLRFLLDAKERTWIRDCEALRNGLEDGIQPWEVWPAELTGYMVPFVTDNLCKYQEAKIWNLLREDSPNTDGHSQDELAARFHSWAVSASSLTRISRGDFVPDWQDKFEDDIAWRASTYWEWRETGLVFRSPETQELLAVMGKKFESLGFPSGFRAFNL